MTNGQTHSPSFDVFLLTKLIQIIATMLQPGPAQQMPPAKLKTIVQPRTEIATKFISPATATSNRSIPRAWVPPKGTPLQYMTHPVFSQMAAATTATFPQMTSATMTNIPQMVPASTTIFQQMAASPATIDLVLLGKIKDDNKA